MPIDPTDGAFRAVVRDRFRGVLIASAAGDALGAAYEFSHPRPGALIEMRPDGPYRRAAGEWLDDTAMAYSVASAAATGIDLLEPAGHDLVAKGFAEWFASKPKDVGNLTRAVLRREQRHRTRHTRGQGAGQSEDYRPAAAMTAIAASVHLRTGGNGSPMRTGPVGAAFVSRSARECTIAAGLISDLTHHDQRVREACQLWACTIRYAILHGNLTDPRHFFLDADPETARFWAPRLEQARTGDPTEFARNGWVVHALQTAWWAITHIPPPRRPPTTTRSTRTMRPRRRRHRHHRRHHRSTPRRPLGRPRHTRQMDLAPARLARDHRPRTTHHRRPHHHPFRTLNHPVERKQTRAHCAMPSRQIA